MNKWILIAAALVLGGCATQSPTGNAGHSAPDAFLQEAAKRPSAPFAGTGWKPLFDGQSLAGWQVTDFTGHGPVKCESGLLVIEAGQELGGVNWTNEVAKMNYEVALDAMLVEGSDFFCGLTFPVGGAYCSLIVGGWGGAVTGLSSIDGEDASENETTINKNYEPHRWYRIRLRVTETKIEAWVDTEKIVDLATKHRTIGLRFGDIELSKPLGFATYQTRAALREIKIRRIEPGADGQN
jgi:Domain of Unknown Function (DUF1080)